MNYYADIQNIVNYIEENISSELNLDNIANEACISKFHFHRMFKSMVGDSLMDYIRKRRLLNAARDIVTSDKTIFEVADYYLFNSHEVFTRAFKRYFNMTPNLLKKDKKIDFYEEKVDIMGVYLGSEYYGTIMNAKLIEKKAFSVAGVSCITTIKDFQQEKSIQKLWYEFFNRMKNINEIKDMNYVYGFCQSDLSENDFNYFAGIETNSNISQEKIIECRDIPDSKYLVFYHKGHFLKILEAYKYIYGVAIPNSGYKLRDELDDFVQYEVEKISGNSEYIEAKIYIPVF